MNDDRPGRPVPVPLTWVDSAQVYIPNMDSLEQDAAIRQLRTGVQKLMEEVEEIKEEFQNFRHRKVKEQFSPMCILPIGHEGSCIIE